MLEGAAELVALLREVPDGLPEPALAFHAEAEMRDAPVARRGLPLEQPGFLGAADELRDGALRQSQALRQRGYGRLLAPVGRSLDHQEQQVALRLQARTARRLFRLAQERPQRRAEFRDGDDVLGGELTRQNESF